MPATPEDVVNQALVLLNYPRRIGSLYDGSGPAAAALELYGQVRDAALLRRKPDWAKRDATLVLLNTAPDITWDAADHPPLPWKFEYSVPADCLLPLQIKRFDFDMAWRPRYQPFRVGRRNDTHSILTNTADAILIYVSQALPPSMWYDDFTDVVVRELAKRLQGNARLWMLELARETVPTNFQDHGAQQSMISLLSPDPPPTRRQEIGLETPEIEPSQRAELPTASPDFDPPQQSDLPLISPDFEPAQRSDLDLTSIDVTEPRQQPRMREPQILHELSSAGDEGA